MIYWHQKLKKHENISLSDFIKVIEFLDNENLISSKFYEHHLIYSFYKEQLTFCNDYTAKQNTLDKFGIGRVTFFNIKKRFR